MTSEKRGIIIKWFDEKGYGFIEPSDGSRHLFFHVRSLQNSQRRDLLGRRVYYHEEIGNDGRPAARHVRLSASLDTPRLLSRRPLSRRSFRAATLLAWAVSVSALAAIILAAHAGYLPIYIPYIYGTMSLITFIAYAVDKAKAGTGQWRTPESTLHGLEFLGGWPGALAAQWHIGHKNRKVSYQTAYWIIVILHVIALVKFAQSPPIPHYPKTKYEKGRPTKVSTNATISR